jgi:parvulin-like peptidyl-prolyl isomerase
LNSTKKALIAAAVAVVFAGGLIFWQVKARKTGPVELTADDMTVLAENQAPQIRQRLATDETARKNFAQDLRRLFAVAEDAQAHGVDKDPDFKRELEYQRSQLLAQFYAEEQGENAVNITDKEVDDYFSQPVNKYKFDQLVEAVKRRNPTLSTELSEDRLKEIKQDVGRVYLMEKKAAEQGLEKKPKVRLQLMFQHARMLVQKYATDTLSKKIEASEAEIKEYMEKHPQPDTEKETRTKAEEVLKRIRGGEDFAKLAQEFGSDATRDQGGDLGWMPENQLDPTFVQAAKALKPGEVSEVVKTNFGLHIIKLEGLKTDTVEGNPQPMIHTRHILFRDPNSNPRGQPQTPADKARMAIEKEKGDKLLEEILNRSHVKVAENYSVKPPEQQPSQGLPPGVAPPPTGQQPQAPQPQESPAKPQQK